MKIGVRISICAALLCTALAMAVLTLADFAPAPESPGGYVLGAAEGRVAVLDAASRSPVSLTDIELSGLREADREKLSTGLPVESREELLSLLEDLGS